MKSKFVKIFSVIISLISITLLSFKYVENIEADSGWDTDYDSSSSWDSGSSWDNDYDYDYDYDYGNDYSSSSSGSGSSSGSSFCKSKNCQNIFYGIVLTIFGLGILVYVIAIIASILKGIKRTTKRIINIFNPNKKKSKQLNIEKKYSLLSQEKANDIIPNFNIEEFNFKSYQIFYDVQIAWMEFYYDKLKELLTDELYNSYVMQLDALKVKNQKNVMKGFELIESKIFELKEENDKYIAKVCLNVKFYDYIENINTNKVLRGNSNKKINNIYILTFIKTKENSNNVNICPQCGTPVEGKVTSICEYCKSKLINETHDWVMSKKEKISQK